MDAADFFSSHLAAMPVIGIFRGATPERTVELCRAAWDAGVGLIEIPVQTDDALPSLEAAIAAGAERGAVVGAGTVTTAERFRVVAEAGARFVISPGLHPEVVEATAAAGLPYLPGVATSTEIAQAVAAGLTWVKAFPAAQLTPGWVTAQRAPFPQVRFVATGGVDADNATAFLEAGCSAVAVGSAFGDPAAIARLQESVTRR